MPADRPSDATVLRPFDTRTALSVVLAACLVLSNLAALPVLLAGPASAAPDDGNATFAVRQGDRCHVASPLGDGTESVESFYDYRVVNDSAEANYSSLGTTGYQRNGVSQLFVYEGRDGYSLVVLHDAVDGTGGGTVTFNVTGLPSAAIASAPADEPYHDREWAVEDDDYSGRDDNWEHRPAADRTHVEWSWASGRTDGGAFHGLGSDGYDEVTVDPGFNDASDFPVEETDYVEGRVDRWALRDGNGTLHDLDMTENVTIAPGDCTADSSADDAPPVARMDLPAEATVGETVAFDGTGSTDDGTITAYDWSFGDGTTATGPTVEHAYESGGEYDVTLTVTDDAGNTDSVTESIRVTEATDDGGDGSDSSDGGDGSDDSDDSDGGDKDDNDDNDGSDGNDDGDDSDGDDGDDDGEDTDDTDGDSTDTETPTDTDTPTDTETPTDTDTPTETEDGTDVGTDDTTADDGTADADGADGDTNNANNGGTGSDEDDDGNENSVRVTEYESATVVWVPAVTSGETVSASIEGVRSDEVRLRRLDVEMSQADDGYRLAVRGPSDDPAAVPAAPADTVLTYFRVQRGDVTNRRIDQVRFYFTVSEGSLPADVAREDLTLWRYHDGGWEPLETASQNGTYVAVAPGFSTFAVGTDDAPGPAVTVSNVTTPGPTVIAGNETAVRATLRNADDATRTTTANLSVDGRVVASKEVTLDPGAARTVEFTRTFRSPGTYAVAVDGVTRYLTVKESGPVMRVTDVETNRTAIETNETVRIRATVRNAGTETGTYDAKLTVFGEVVAVKEVSVPPGESRTVTFTQQFAAPGTFSVVVGNRSADDRSAEISVAADAADEGPSTEPAEKYGFPLPPVAVFVFLLGGVVTLAIGYHRSDL